MLLKALLILLCFVVIFGCLDAAPNKLKQLSKKSIKNMRRWLSDKRRHSSSSSSSTISLSSNEEVGPSNRQLVIDENRLANDPAERQRSNAEHLATRSVESSVSRSTEQQHPTTQRSANRRAESPHPTESQANCQSEAIDYCTICQSSLSDGGILKELQKCKHSFHQDCIDKWLTDINHNSCPNCREEVSPSELSRNQNQRNNEHGQSYNGAFDDVVANGRGIGRVLTAARNSINNLLNGTQNSQQMNTSQSVYNNPLYHVSAPALSTIPRDQLRLLYTAPPGSFVRLQDYYGRTFTVHVIE